MSLRDKMNGQYDYSNIPKCLQNELEFVVDGFKEKMMDLMNNNDGAGVKNRLYSRIHTYKNFNFRLMILPRAKLTSGGSIEGSISAYLEAVPSPNWPPNWIWINTKYTVTLVNQKDYRKSYFMSDVFNFKGENNMSKEKFRLISEMSAAPVISNGVVDYYTSAGPEADRGWSDFFNIKTLLDQRSGFVSADNDRVVFRAGVFPISCEPTNLGKGNVDMFGTERSCTGHVGLRNLGATCYMNSLLQSLYHIGRFRKAVYSIPLTKSTLSSNDNLFNSGSSHIQVSHDLTKEREVKASSNAANVETDIDTESDKCEDTYLTQNLVKSSFLNQERLLPMTLLGDSTEDSVEWTSSIARTLFEYENDGIASLESIVSSSNISSHDFSNSNGLMSDNQSNSCGGGEQIKISSALQTLFYELQTSNDAANCRELMRSFGWDASDAFTQHDAQELNRLLCDRLEEEMKDTTVDGSIKDLFEGEYENFIDCLDVDCSSRRKENFYDIQIDVEGVGSLEEGLEKFVQEEILDGENMYEAEGYGKQRARKGVRFQRFPPVVQFHLKRFQFNIQSMDMIKLNDYFTFPEKLDLSHYISEDCREKSGGGRNSETYILHTVVIHQGDVHSGHYYAYIRPNLGSNWYRFDDEKVTQVSSASAIEDNFGGFEYDVWDYLGNPDREIPKRLKTHSAYILVYIREDQAEELLEEPVPQKVNPDLVIKYKKEQEIINLRRKLRNDINEHVRVQLLLSTNYNGSKSSRPRVSSIHTDINTFPWSCIFKCPRDYSLNRFHRDVEQRFIGRGASCENSNSANLVSHLFLLVNSDQFGNNNVCGSGYGCGCENHFCSGNCSSNGYNYNVNRMGTGGAAMQSCGNFHTRGNGGGLSFSLCVSSPNMILNSMTRMGGGHRGEEGQYRYNPGETVRLSDLCRKYYRGLWNSSCPTLYMCLYLEDFSNLTERIVPCLSSLNQSYLEKRQKIESSLRKTTNEDSQTLLLLRYFDIFDPKISEYCNNFSVSNEIPNLHNLGIVMVSQTTVLKDLNDYVLMVIEKEMPDLFNNVRPFQNNNQLGAGGKFCFRICLETTNGCCINNVGFSDGKGDSVSVPQKNVSGEDDHDGLGMMRVGRSGPRPANGTRNGEIDSRDSESLNNSGDSLSFRGFSTNNRVYPLLDPRCSVKQLQLPHGSSLIFSLNLEDSVIRKKRSELVMAMEEDIGVSKLRDWLEEEQINTSSFDMVKDNPTFHHTLPKELSAIKYPEFPSIDFHHWFENHQNTVSICIYLWNPLDGEHSHSSSDGFNITQNPCSNNIISLIDGNNCSFATDDTSGTLIEQMQTSSNPIVRSFSRHNIKSIKQLILDLRWPVLKSWIYISSKLNVDPRCLALAKNSLNPYDASLTTIYTIIQNQQSDVSTNSLFKSLCLYNYHNNVSCSPKTLNSPFAVSAPSANFSLMAVELSGRSFYNLSQPGKQLVSLSIVDWNDEMFCKNSVKVRSLVHIDISNSVESLIEQISAGKNVVACREFSGSSFTDRSGGGINLSRIFNIGEDLALPRLRIMEFSNNNTVGLYKGNEKLSNVLNIEDPSRGEGVISIGYISDGLRLERDFTCQELNDLEQGSLISVLVIQDSRDFEYSSGNAFALTLESNSKLIELKRAVQRRFKLNDKDISRWKFYRFEFKNLQLIRDNDTLVPTFNKNIDLNIYGFSPNVTILAQLQHPMQNSHKNSSSRPLRI